MGGVALDLGCRIEDMPRSWVSIVARGVRASASRSSDPLLAERSPDSATADYLHEVFEPTARAIAGLEKALAAAGQDAS